MPNMNKMVIMDWGGVIDNDNNSINGWKARTKSIIRRLGNSDDEISTWATFDVDDKKYNICEINDDILLDKWISYVINKYALSCNKEEFLEVYKEEYANVIYYKEIIEILYKTKKYCQIGILSNLTKLDKDRLVKQIDLSKLDYVGLSFELEVMKPKNKIYQLVEEQTNIEPNNILFIDDRIDNINGARGRGWNVLLATGEDKELIDKTIWEFVNK